MDSLDTFAAPQSTAGVRPSTLPKALDRLPGAFNFDIASPAGLVASAEENARQSGNFLNGMGQFLFGENNGSILGGVPLLGPLVRGASAIPGAKLISDVVGGVVGGGVGAVVGAAERIPLGWLPGGSDATFDALPHTPEWQVVNDAANSDLLMGGNQKFSYTQRFLEDQQGNIGTSQGMATLSPGLLAGPGGSLWQFAGQALGLFQLPQRVVERGLAGTAKVTSGMNRVEETLARAANKETLSAVEQAVVSHIGDGSWTEGRALDFMASHGSGLSHDGVLQVIGTFATDPTVLAALGSGGLARLAKVGANVIESGMATSEALTGVQRAGLVARGFTAGELGPVAKTARSIIDPLSAFGGHGPASDAVVDLLVDNVAVKGFHNAFGVGASDAYRIADEMGITAAVMDAAAGRGSTVALQLLAARRQATAVANGLGRELMETVPAGSVSEDLLRNAPRNIEQIVREEVARTREFLWGAPGSEARVNLSRNFAASFGGDEAKWAEHIDNASDDTLAFMHNVLYGHDERTVRLALQKGANEYTGTMPYERLNMVNDTTLHNLGAQSLIEELAVKKITQEALDAGFTTVDELKVTILRDAQKRFPELRKYVIDNHNPSRAINWAIDDLTRRLRQGTLPAMVTRDEMKDLPEGVQSLMETLQHRILAFRPEDGVLWNIERNAEGLYEAAGNPWIEHVMSDVTYRPGFALPTNLAGSALARAAVRPLDWLESGSRLLLKRVSGAALRENARQRAVIYGVEKLGLDESVTREIFQRLTEHLDVVRHPTIRSLTSQDMWSVAEAVIPRGSGVGRREVLAMVLDAFEGDLRYIGLSVKFTGRAKKVIAALTGNESNFAGQVSEDVYNLVRFRINPLFQTQEAIEPWVLNSQRGVSMANRGLEADTTAEAVRRNLVNTSVMRVGDTDAIEYGAQSMAGKGVLEALAPKSGRFARLGFPDVRGMKRFGQLRGIMAGEGRAVRSSFKTAGIENEFLAFKASYAKEMGRVVDDNETALRLVAEWQSANLDIGIDLAARPGERLMNFDHMMAEAEQHIPSDIGELKTLALDAMARRIGNIGEHQFDSIGDLRHLLATGDVSVEEVRGALLELGAGRTYVTRVERALNFHYEDFWGQVRDGFNASDDEIAQMQNFVEGAARTQGMKPAEFLSQVVEPVVPTGRGAKIAPEMEAVGQALSIIRAPESGGTAEDFANQLGRIFWSHMHPSGREALIESVRKTRPEAADLLAAKIAAGRKITAAEFDAQFPGRATTVTSWLTGKRMKVQSTLGPGLMDASPEIQEPVIRAVYRIQTEFPGLRLAHVDIVPAEKLPLWDKSAIAGTEGLTTGTHNDRAAILLSGDYFGGNQAEHYAAMQAADAKIRATALAQGAPIPPAAVNMTPSGTVYHELGHAVLEKISASSSVGPRSARTAANKAKYAELNAFLDQLPDSPAGRALSRYSAKSPAEVQAELFDAAFNPETDLSRYATKLPPKTSKAFHDPDMPVGSWGLEGPQTVQEAVDTGRRLLQEAGLWVPPVAPARGLGWTPEMTQGLLARAASGVRDADPNMERAYQYFTKWSRAVLAEGTLNKKGHELSKLLKDMPIDNAVPYNKTHALLLDTVSDRLRTLENDTYRMQYYARDRSVLERSINHPFFGIYPASYMWFKILPELARFIAKEPFGLRTGALAYTLMDVEKAVAIQREYDPDFDKFVEGLGHSAVIWMLGYLLPATPWDIPSAMPAWMRDLAGQGLASEQRAKTGAPPKDFNFWSPISRIQDYVSPLRSVDQTNRVLKEVGNIVSGSPLEQQRKGGARTFPVIGPFPSEQAAPVQQLVEPLTNAVDQLTEMLSKIGT